MYTRLRALVHHLNPLASSSRLAMTDPSDKAVRPFFLIVAITKPYHLLLHSAAQLKQ
jgi:hypothetical protein